MSRALYGGALLGSTSQWLARTPGVLRAHVQGQSRETLDRRPGSSAWSQIEILAHLADFEVVCLGSGRAYPAGRTDPEPECGRACRGDPVCRHQPFRIA